MACLHIPRLPRIQNLKGSQQAYAVPERWRRNGREKQNKIVTKGLGNTYLFPSHPLLSANGPGVGGVEYATATEPIRYVLALAR
jgi:hypothetical protein